MYKTHWVHTVLCLVQRGRTICTFNMVHSSSPLYTFVWQGDDEEDEEERQRTAALVAHLEAEFKRVPTDVVDDAIDAEVLENDNDAGDKMVEAELANSVHAGLLGSGNSLRLQQSAALSDEVIEDVPGAWEGEDGLDDGNDESAAIGAAKSWSRIVRWVVVLATRVLNMQCRRSVLCISVPCKVARCQSGSICDCGVPEWL